MGRRGRKKQRTTREVKRPSLLDIVIPVWDGFEFLAECLKALPAAVGDVPTSVILYDNGSDKETADNFYAGVGGARIIRGKENMGFARGCNLGVKSGFSPLILLLNSDVVMSPGSIEKMVKRMDDPEIGVCGGRLLFANNTPHGPAGHIQHVGLMLTIKAEVVHSFIGWSNDNPRTRRNEERFAVTGACFMTRRNLWNQIGGLYEGYGMGTYEEVDYCCSVSVFLKKKVIVVNEAEGTHYVAASATAHQTGFPLAQNRALFMSRWANNLVQDDWRIL